MKINNILTILTLLLLSTFVQADIKTIEPQAVLKLIQKQQAPLILDVRSENEFTQGHIQGAINLPYDLIHESQRLDAYKEQEIIIYCRSGRRAKIAADLLREKGFKQLIDLNGDIILWQKLDYPLVTEKEF